MAKRQVVSYNYTCDVCGGTIPESEADSANRKFSWEGGEYAVDVCGMHATELDTLLSQLKTFVAAGQRSTGRRGRRAGVAPSSSRAPRGRRSASTASASTGPKRSDLSAVRAWARESGRPVSERGRIPASLLEAYDAAHGTSGSATPAASDAAAPATITATPRPARKRSSGPRAAATSGPKRGDLGAVRAWARESGRSVSERGRIPASLLEAYDAAHGGASESSGPAAPATRKRAARKSAPVRKRAARKAASAPSAE